MMSHIYHFLLSYVIPYLFISKIFIRESHFVVVDFVMEKIKEKRWGKMVKKNGENSSPLIVLPVDRLNGN